jgi:acyl-coenzyme A thioesterase PaaI-like protein
VAQRPRRARHGHRDHETTPGGATAEMKVRQDMVNGHGIAHGGYIFALADTNFAYACNSFNHTRWPPAWTSISSPRPISAIH